jgi:hypothetical protein
MLEMGYRPPSRLRRVAKWAGVLVCLSIVVLWVVSSIRPIYPTWLKAETTWFGGVGYGFAECHFPAGVLVHRSGELFRGRSRFHVPVLPVFRRTVVASGRVCWYAGFPLWLPLVLTGSATGLLFHLDRRPPRDCCQRCGYSLCGNVSGVCPECGTIVA